MVIEQRDHWKARAEAAEDKLLKMSTRQQNQGARGAAQYARLKRLVAAELHPDQAKSDGIDRLVGAELFKAIWPKMQEIEKD